MRTRAQKRKSMPELAQQLQRRLRALKATAVSTSASPRPPPVLKKRKIEDVSSPLLLTPNVHKSPNPTLSAIESLRKTIESKTSVNKPNGLRRTLQYINPEIPDLDGAPQAKLQRICSGQMACHNNRIVGRLKELEILRDVLKGQAEHGSCLFIIGPPGTGKTSSVNKVLIEEGFEAVAIGSESRQKRVVKSTKPAVKLNCSTFTDPAALYTAVAQLVKMSTNWIVPDQLDPFAMDEFIAVQICYRKCKYTSIAVVLDEVDQLLSLPARMQPTVQELLRFYVRWAAIAPHDVKFLAIMNGVDMYEQVSRINGVTDSQVPRVIFGSYTHQDLLLIMHNYMQSAPSSSADALEVTDSIDPRAMEFIARKVAARDGDVRLAITLLQQSARYALQRSSTTDKSAIEATQAKILMQDVFQCTTTILSSPTVHQIKQLPRQAKVLLYVITALAPGSDTSNSKPSQRHCDMNQVTEELVRLSKQPQTSWIPCLSRKELQTHLMSLNCYALVRPRGPKCGDRDARPAPMSARAFWTSKLSSCVSMPQVARALQDDPALSQLLF